MLQELINAVRGIGTTTIVSCPNVPAGIPGIAAADAFDAGDAFGTLLELKVPKMGEIRSATFWDLDYEGTQIDFMVYNVVVAQIASDAAWAPADIDQLHLITVLSFVSYINHANSYTFELTNIGKAYTTPLGKIWLQGRCIATPTIAAGAMPRIQLQIQSFDPSFKEG